MRRSLFALFLLILPAILFADEMVVGNFSARDLQGWKEKEFVSKTSYRLEKIDNRHVLAATSKSSASGLVKKIRIDLERYPILNWSWRIENRLPSANEQSRTGDDYAARIYVIVSGGLLFTKTKALNYVWANNSPTGHVWENAYAGKNSIMMALRSASDKTATWYTEKRNVREDLKKIFGKNTRFIHAIAIMTDTDDTSSETKTFYGDIYFTPSPKRPMPGSDAGSDAGPALAGLTPLGEDSPTNSECTPSAAPTAELSTQPLMPVYFCNFRGLSDCLLFSKSAIRNSKSSPPSLQLKTRHVRMNQPTHMTRSVCPMPDRH